MQRHVKRCFLFSNGTERQIKDQMKIKKKPAILFSQNRKQLKDKIKEEACCSSKAKRKYQKKHQIQALLIIHHKLPISSTKTMHGSSFMAKEKTAEESFWDSPYHLSVRDATSRLMKRAPASLATALASRVLPQPGGPCSNTPYRWSNTAKAGPELNMLEPTEASLTVGPQDYQLI